MRILLRLCLNCAAKTMSRGPTAGGGRFGYWGNAITFAALPLPWRGVKAIVEASEMVQGRNLNIERRCAVAELRQQGLSLAEIGHRLGITRQRVSQLLKRFTFPRVRAIPCSACGEPIVSTGALPDDQGTALCLDCLAQRPQAPFAQRLGAQRLAAGLTRAELARRAGMSNEGIRGLERHGRKPQPETLARLVGVLGRGLIPTESQQANNRQETKPQHPSPQVVYILPTRAVALTSEELPPTAVSSTNREVEKACSTQGL
jgi:transcriptional regulator with XRE-family HTH domain